MYIWYLAKTYAILLTCPDDFLHVLFWHSTLSLYGNQLQQLPAAVFSGLTSLRSHVVFVCNENVCILGDTSAQAALITGDDVCYLAYVCGRITPPSVLPEACISTACNEHVFMLGDTGTKHNHSPDTCTLTSTDPQTVFLRVLMIFDMFCFATAICIFQTTSCSSCLQRCSRAWHPWGLTLYLYAVRLRVFLVIQGTKHTHTKQSSTQIYFDTFRWRMPSCLLWLTHTDDLCHGRVYAIHPQTYVSISCSDVYGILLRRRTMFCLPLLMIFSAFRFSTSSICIFKSNNCSSCLQRSCRDWHCWDLT